MQIWALLQAIWAGKQHETHKNTRNFNQSIETPARQHAPQLDMAGFKV